jgi:hypothetical protein
MPAIVPDTQQASRHAGAVAVLLPAVPSTYTYTCPRPVSSSGSLTASTLFDTATAVPKPGPSGTWVMGAKPGTAGSGE